MVCHVAHNHWLLAQVIIWVELTQSQRSYYKAVYEGQIGTLLKGVKKGNLPNMRNVVSGPAGTPP